MKTLPPVLMLTLALAGGCVGNKDYENLQMRVQQQDQQLRQLQPAQADSWAQVQALRQEVNQLRGQIDDLQNAGGARALVERVQRHDAALRQVESSLALNLNLDAPAAVPVPNGATNAAPQTGPQHGGYNTGITPSAATAGMTPPSQNQALTPPPPATDMAQALYDAGLKAYNARNYTAAERSFSDLAKKYPSSKLASNAQYYVGECYFQRNDFGNAALAYDKVITQYKGSSRAPAAYLKQGIAFSKLGQGAAAKARMQELIKKYPNSAEAARAKSFLQTNK